MAGKGGARQGAGRKAKADKYAGAINRAEKKIVDRLPQIVDAMLNLALGATVEEYNPLLDKKVIYSCKPDRAAGEYLMDRIMGKPTQPLANEGDEPLCKVYVGVDLEAV